MASVLPPPWRHHRDNVVIHSGQAELFKVFRDDDPGSYALKRLRNADRSARFQREIKAMQDLEAAGLAIVPKIVDTGLERRGRPYYVMPWYEGGSLEAAISDRRFADLRVAIRLLLQLVDALDALHSFGWAHRDLKPANVLLAADRLVLCDLGLCLPVEVAWAEARLTSTLEAVGSRYYIAPENESGIFDEVDQRPADFYAFGKISWTLLIGRPPLARELQLERANRLAALANDERLASWDEVCEQLLRVDPRARLCEWPTVRSELEHLLSSLELSEAESSYETNELDSLASAAKRFARSRAASEVQASRMARASYQQQVDALRKAAWDAAAAAQGVFDITESSGGLVQAGIQDSSSFTLQRLIAAGALDGLADLVGRVWDEHCLALSSAGSMGVSALFHPPPLSAYLGGYVLADETHAWMLRVPFLAYHDLVLVPTMTARYRSIDGPYRLGLPAARRAAQALGASVFQAGVGLVREYIELLEAGRPVDDLGRWIEEE